MRLGPKEARLARNKINTKNATYALGHNNYNNYYISLAQPHLNTAARVAV